MRTHEDMQNGRNWAYAHNSPEQASRLLANAKEQEEQNKIRFVFAQSGITFRPPEVTWSKSRLHAILSLCRFHLDRITRDVEKLIKDLSGDKIYNYGEYVIGDSFP